MISSTFTTNVITGILSFVMLTNAHMIMKTPIPYGRGVIDNSPLKQDGSDYPCKGLTELTSQSDINYLVPGVPNTLSFTGSAVHGGGSCQIALTTDLKPNKASQWTVIKSIEGGCPANVAGNLAADPNGSGASTFQYTVPIGFPDGSYSIAWTWFNRVGNREMYMNCGRAVIGNKKKRYAAADIDSKIEQRATSYPDLFKANLDIFPSCKVPENINVAFPNPGTDVQVIGTVTPPEGNCGTGSSTPVGGSSGSGASSVAASGAGPATTPTRTASSTANAGATGGFASGNAGQQSTTLAVVPTQSTGKPGVFVSGAASQTTQAAASTTASAAPIQPVPTSSTGGGSTSVTGASVQGTACTSEGAWSCSADGKSFQRCASGLWSASMQMASGTTCTPGISMNLSMNVVSLSSKAKRDLKAHERRSAHRRSFHISS